MHGKPCTVQKVKKESPNQGRSFLCCAEPIKESCNFFQWVKAPKPKEVDEDPLEPGCFCMFSNPPSYQYTVKNTGVKFTSGETNRKKAYNEYLSCNEKVTPTTTPKRPINVIDDETPPCSPSGSPPKKRPITPFSETFRMPPACRKGICGHFECFTHALEPYSDDDDEQC